jgi:hypothetical protein
MAKKPAFSEWEGLGETPTEDKSFMLRDPEPETAPPAAAGNDYGVLLHEFIHDVLPYLTADQYFELVCAIPLEHQIKDEIYEGEESGEITLHGQIRRMQTAVKAMSARVFLNGKVKHGVDVADAQKVFNACTTAFKTLISFESEIYTLERMQAVEKATVKLLKERYPHLVDEFLSGLEEELSQVH